MAVNNGFWAPAGADAGSVDSILHSLGDLTRKAEQMASIRPDGPNTEAAKIMRQCMSQISEVKTPQIEPEQGVNNTAGPRFS